MTYNIRNGRGWDGRVDLERVASVIAAFDPDVVALQEVDLDHVRSHRVDQGTELAGRLDMTATYAPYIEGGADRHGIVTLTRRPVLETRYIALAGVPSRLRSEPRCALVTRLAAPTASGHIDVLNTHLSMMPAERGAQAIALAAQLDGDELIALGDLNCRPSSKPFKALTQNLTPAVRGIRSWPAMLPTFQLDHILVRGSLTVVRAGVWNEGHARRASDHLPVFAELAVNGD